jgi:DNA-binding XRE family transcriptional regulator
LDEKDIPDDFIAREWKSIRNNKMFTVRLLSWCAFRLSLSLIYAYYSVLIFAYFFVFFAKKSMPKNISELIAQNIKRFREDQHMSQEKLAEEAGLHRTYIGMVERCEKNITVVSLERIAQALNVELTDLIHD